MAWSAPSNQTPPDKDPWTGQPKKPTGQDKGPPLLEDLFKSLFKKSSSDPGSQKQSGLSLPNFSAKLITGLVAAAAVFAWAGAGVYKLTNNQEALVFHWGVYQKSIGAGLHWQPRGIDRVVVYDREKILQDTIVTDAISADANLVHLELKLHYHVNDPKDYFEHAGNHTAFIRALATSVAQQTASSNHLNDLLSESKTSSFVSQLQQNLAKAFDAQQLGIQVNDVSVDRILVPDGVKDIFNEINALYADQAEQRQKAADYEKQILPPAETKANQLIADAKTYASEATLKAQAEVADFLAELPIYQKAPAFTRYHLYSQAMQNILSKVTTVVMDDKVHANVVLPNISDATSADSAAPTTDAAAPTATNSEANTGVADNTQPSSMYADIKGGY